MHLRRAGKAKRAANFESARLRGWIAGKLLGEYEELIRKKLKFLSLRADCLFLSAKTGDRAQKLYPLIDQVGGGAETEDFDAGT